MNELIKNIKESIPQKPLKWLVIVFGIGIAGILLEIFLSVVFMVSFFPRFFTPTESFCLAIIFVVKLVSQTIQVVMKIWELVLSQN